jgi:hypothetical protein
MAGISLPVVERSLFSIAPNPFDDAGDFHSGCGVRVITRFELVQR